MNEQQVIQRLDQFGHLKMPFGQVQAGPWPDFSDLTIASPEVKLAIQSYQSMHATTLEQIIARNNPQLTSPSPGITGEVDAATAELLGMARCWTRDYDPDIAMAVGSGNWARCSGVGEFHRAITKVVTPIPDFLEPVWPDVWSDVVKSYEAFGMSFQMRQDIADAAANILISFVKPPSGDGWIGLAIVGQGQKCNSRIWAQFDKNYKPANIRREWTTLIKHELGHNCGLQHSTGGVMNPYIIPNLPLLWTGDPSYPLLVQRFGGKPIPPVGQRVFDLVIAKRYDDDGSYETTSVIAENITSLPGPWS